MTFALCFGLLLLLVIGIAEYALYASATSSPSFERQEINDDDVHADWFFWPSRDSDATIEAADGEVLTLPYAIDKSSCEFGKDISPQIESVSYSSDGKTLNVTLWLSSKLLESNLLENEINSTNFELDEFLPLWKKVKFVVVMDVKSAFNEGIDYRIEFTGNQINSTHNQWQQDLYEISLDGRTKLKSSVVYNEFPSQKEFLDFSIDLSSVSNPKNYNILSYVINSYVKSGQYCRMVDSTNWIMIPPPHFSVSVSPSSLELRPRDDKDFQIFIKGTAGVSDAIIDLDASYENKNYALLNFLPDSFTISALGNNTSILNVEIPDNLTRDQIGEFKSLYIPIGANISFPTSITNREGDTFSNNNSIGLTESANVTVTILPPLEITDHIQLGMANASEILRPVGELWAILVPIGGGLLSFIIYIRRKKEK